VPVQSTSGLKVRHTFPARVCCAAHIGMRLVVLHENCGIPEGAVATRLKNNIRWGRQEIIQATDRSQNKVPTGSWA